MGLHFPKFFSDKGYIVFFIIAGILEPFRSATCELINNYLSTRIIIIIIIIIIWSTEQNY